MSVREFGKKNAKALLRAAGMTKSHPDYAFFHQILTSVCEAATKRTRQFRSIGEQLRKATTRGAVDVSAVDRIATACEQVDLAPDVNAVRGIFQAIKARVARQRSNSNLRVDKTLTDADVRAALKAFKTRERQAAHLGITERQLYRRLRGMTSGRAS